MFGIVFYQYGVRKYIKVDIKGLEDLSNLHEEGKIVITTITCFTLGGMVLDYNDFWDYYEDFCD